MDQTLMNRGLPKWPKMLVTGVPVTQEQAKEIIRRTDMFFATAWSGNDHKYIEWAWKLLKMPYKHHYDRNVDWQALSRAEEDWKGSWGFIETQYVHNSWISSSFIGGPSGWCHPSGAIGFIDNVGKWPSVEDVFNDWTLIARAFPFLDLGVTLFNGEECEEPITPVVSMRIKDGVVNLVEPSENVHAGHPEAHRNDTNNDEMDFNLTLEREHGIPRSWINDWSKLV